MNCFNTHADSLLGVTSLSQAVPRVGALSSSGQLNAPKGLSTTTGYQDWAEPWPPLTSTHYQRHYQQYPTHWATLVTSILKTGRWSTRRLPIENDWVSVNPAVRSTCYGQQPADNDTIGESRKADCERFGDLQAESIPDEGQGQVQISPFFFPLFFLVIFSCFHFYFPLYYYSFILPWLSFVISFFTPLKLLVVSECPFFRKNLS